LVSSFFLPCFLSENVYILSSDSTLLGRFLTDSLELDVKLIELALLLPLNCFLSSFNFVILWLDRTELCDDRPLEDRAKLCRFADKARFWERILNASLLL